MPDDLDGFERMAGFELDRRRNFVLPEFGGQRMGTATLLSRTEAAAEWLFDIDCRDNAMPDYLEVISSCSAVDFFLPSAFMKRTPT